MAVSHFDPYHLSRCSGADTGRITDQNDSVHIPWITQCMGLLAKAGIETDSYHQIRMMILLSTSSSSFSTNHHHPPPPHIPIWIRLHLVQALIMAASGGDDDDSGGRRHGSFSGITLPFISSGLRSPSHPQQQRRFVPPTSKDYYFCFTGKSSRSNTTTTTANTTTSNTMNMSGLQRTINGLSSWPFRNDFGLAVWFRMESRVLHHHPSPESPTILFSIRTENGGGIVISIVPIEESVSTATTDHATTNTATATPDAYTIAIAIYDSHATTTSTPTSTMNFPPSHTIRTARHGIVLLPQIWYHIAVRHTRARMKGVFAMSSREQISILLDGKCMCTESLAFPTITDALYNTINNNTIHSLPNTTASESFSSKTTSSILKLRRNHYTQPHSSMNVTISFGTNFVGQTGALYVFNDHVSDATFRALYEMTGGALTTAVSATATNGNNNNNIHSSNHTNSSTDKILKRHGSTKQQHGDDETWDARRSDMVVRKSRLLDVNMKLEDAEELVLSQRRTPGYHKQRMMKKMIRILDLADSDDYCTNDTDMQEYPIHLQKSAFGSKIFLTWDPQRTLDNTLALELRIGAHVNMNGVYAWGYNSVQDVISSVGGIQSLLPIMQSILTCELEPDIFADSDTNDAMTKPRYDVMVAIPNLIRLFTAFIQSHNDNARELLRCGGIDILEQQLLNCKKIAFGKKSTLSLFGSINIYPQIAQELVDALLDLRTSCSHFASMETKVYSRLLFNIPLWFSGSSQLPGAALLTELLPVLSSLTRLNPEKVRDFVDVKTMVVVLREFFAASTNEIVTNDDFDRFTMKETTAPSSLRHPLSLIERRHASKILLGMIFTVLASGTTSKSFVPFLNLVSHTLDTLFGVTVGYISKSPSTNQAEDRLLAIDTCMVLLLLLQLRPVVDGLYENFAQACGGVQGGASWILMAMVNVPDDEIRSIGIRCIANYLDVTNHGPDMPLSLGSVVKPIAANHDTHNDVSATVRRASTRITEIAKGLATGSQSYRPIILQTTRLTARVVYKVRRTAFYFTCPICVISKGNPF